MLITVICKETDDLFSLIKNELKPSIKINFSTVENFSTEKNSDLLVVDLPDNELIPFLETNISIPVIAVLEPGKNNVLLKNWKKYNLYHFAYRPYKINVLCKKIEEFVLTKKIRNKSIVSIEKAILSPLKTAIDFTRRFGNSIVISLVTYHNNEGSHNIDLLYKSLRNKDTNNPDSLFNTDIVLEWKNNVLVILPKCTKDEFTYAKEKIQRHTNKELIFVSETLKFNNWDDNSDLDEETVLLRLEERLLSIQKKNTIKLVKSGAKFEETNIVNG